MAKKIIKRTKDGETLYFGTHTDAVLSEVRVGKESLTATLSAIITSFASYYTKSETYSQAEVDQLVAAIKQFNVVVASSLPTASASTMNTIYLIPSSHSEQGNVKDEFITIQDGGSYKWEQIGTTAIDLSDYSTTAEMNAAIASALSAYSTTSAMNAAVASAVESEEDRAKASVGYYVCDTAAGTASKTVSAAGYTLAVGGNMRVKMTNANTAANVTLNINSTGAKALYYNGEHASASNSWEASEVVTVYYDGTQYQCASGGSGGTKIINDGRAELDIADERGNVVVRFHDGEIETKNFKSAVAGNINVIDTPSHDFVIADEYGNVIIELDGGNVETKNFDSRFPAANVSYSKLRFLSWNIAHFNMGSGITNAIITEEDYNMYLPVYRKIFNEMNADFITIPEFESPFWKSHDAFTTKRELFPNYQYYKDNATSTTNGNWVAFFSHLPLSNVQEVAFSTYPSGQYRYYLVGDMQVNGKTVKVVSTHLTHATPNIYAPAQIQQLITTFANDEYVIMLGDWNTSPSGFQPFLDAGYSMANNDYLGTLITNVSTQYYEGAMDNIIVKGGSINNIRVINPNESEVGLLSDHFIIYCDVVF